ncbi:MAG: ABC transporter permease [Acidobacteriaceae bacterium]|nr:ABC transporter permease [Acidobacteriaceae bacterium]
MNDELRFHLEEEVNKYEKSGLPHDEALRRARLIFGGIDLAKEECREARGVSFVETTIQDLGFSLRQVRRSFSFTVAAVFALGLGIGINTAIFTAYKAMIARPLDALHPRKMVNVSLIRQSGAPSFTFSYPDYEAYRDSVRCFSGVMAFSGEHLRFSHLSRSEGKKPVLVEVFAVSRNYFRVLGIEPLRGRGFDAGRLPALPTIISEHCWEERFARDSAVLGRIVYLNGIGFTIVGITARDFVGTNVAAPDFWLPLETEPQVHSDHNWLTDRENERYRLFARLAPGETLERAQAEMNVVAKRLRALHDPHSDSAKPGNAVVSPGSPFPLPLRMYPGLRFAIVLIFCAGAMVLLVACANVSSLQLARADSRQNELRTRLSLGASRTRIIRQLLTESIVMSLLAGVAASLCTWAFLKAVVFYGVRALPEQGGTLVLDVAPDLKTLLFVLCISLLAGLLFGLAPALENSRMSLGVSERSSTSGIRTRRLQNVLVASQVALSLVLLITGSMLLRSALRSLALTTGYEARRTLNLDLQFPETLKYKAEGQSAFVQELRRRLEALPGVAGVTSARPPTYLSSQTAVYPLGANGRQLATSLLHYTYVEPNSFEVLNIPLLMGHTFLAMSRQQDNAVIVSKSAAEQLWPGENPIGQRLRLAAIDEKRHNSSELAAIGPTYQVVGVAGDTRGVEFDGSDAKQVYLPLPQDLLASRSILIRTHIDAVRVKKVVESLVSSLDPDVLPTVSTLQELLRDTAPFITSSLGAAIASVVGFAGLILSLTGIYGTVSYIVALRTRELGIRIAVGAQKTHILRLILGQSARPVLAGIAVGIVLGAGASFVLRGVLYGLNPVDPLAFGGTSAAFLAIALTAAYPPSRRAMRIDPAVALRYE